MAFTRTTHTVRIKDQDNKFFADVEILDAISLILPNGFEVAYNVSADNVDPAITDTTGDGNAKAATNASTRASHMTRLTGSGDSTQYMDVEVCDAFTITGPNNAQHVIKCPSANAVPAVTDNAGGGLGIPADAGSTRAQHVVKLIDQVESTNSDGTVTVTQNDAKFVLGVITDAMAFSGPPMGLPFNIVQNFGGPADTSSVDESSAPWGAEHVLKFPNTDVLSTKGTLSPGPNTNDTTIYSTDSAGQLVPPPNTDPNVYVYFPAGSQGPFLDAGQGVDMGPLWWLRQVGELTTKSTPTTPVYDITANITVNSTAFNGYGGYPVRAVYSNGTQSKTQDFLIPDPGTDAGIIPYTMSITLSGATSAPILTLYSLQENDTSLGALFFQEPALNTQIAVIGYVTATETAGPNPGATATSPQDAALGDVVPSSGPNSLPNNPPGALWGLSEGSFTSPPPFYTTTALGGSVNFAPGSATFGTISTPASGFIPPSQLPPA